MDQHCITFHRENSLERAKTLIVPTGTRLSEAAANAGFPLRTHCGGAGTCGKCLIRVGQQQIRACQTTVDSALAVGNLDVYIPDSSLRDNEQNIVVPLDSNSTGVKAERAGHRYGVAVDIGTTTLAAELHDFSGKMPVQTVSRANPQRQFGDDVISRIQKVMEHSSALTTMQRLIVGAINEMTTELAAKAGIAPQEISIMVAAGNTVMQSILFGIDPSPLGGTPFHASTTTFPARLGSEIGLTMSAEGTIEALPIFGGFVGGDIVAGILTVHQLPLFGVPWLFLDIGTNGEIVLSHRGKLFTAATAAGPTFEGANIRHGTLAVPGAIDHVAIPSGTNTVEKITVSTIGNKPPIGICGSGLIDAVAVLLDHGIILPNGRFAEKQSHIELVAATESDTGEAIVLTQKDIRELQLATGAIRAGITLLCQTNDVPLEMIDQFYVAGGFGQSIRLSSARRIGLLPPIPPERFQFCGNTSLAGARAVLLDPTNSKIAHQIVDRSQHGELAELPQFQQVFAESMQFAPS